MPDENALSAANLCRNEARLTDCADTRVALLSLARAIEAANADPRRNSRPAGSSPDRPAPSDRP